MDDIITTDGILSAFPTIYCKIDVFYTESCIHMEGPFRKHIKYRNRTRRFTNDR